jgi:hypothetical protein
MSARAVACALGLVVLTALLGGQSPAAAALPSPASREAALSGAAQGGTWFAGLDTPVQAPSARAGAGDALVADFRDDRPALADDGGSLPGWDVVFDGASGRAGVRVVPDRGLRLLPDTADAPGETHAALVVSQATFESDTLDLAVAWTTRRQLRGGSQPNPWEMGWVVWDYQDADHFTYLVLKPNGWEIGRRDPAGVGGQRFLATGSSRKVVPGQRSSVSVRRVGTLTRVTLGGQVLAAVRVADHETGGSVGFYCEDSVVDWHWVRAHAGLRPASA